MPTKEWREKNKDSVRASRRKWYNNNRKKAMAAIVKRKQELREWLRGIKAGWQCNSCGEDHPACLCCHHRDPNEKELDIARVTGHGWSKQRILKEIEKCDILCHNCHAKIHWNE